MRYRVFSLGKLTPASAGAFLCTEGCWRENVRVDSGLLPGLHPLHAKMFAELFLLAPAITRTIVRTELHASDSGLGTRDSGFGDRVLAFWPGRLGFPGQLAGQQKFVRKKNGSLSIIGILHASTW